MQEYWNGLPFPSPGDLPDPGIEPVSTALQVDALLSKPQEVWRKLSLSFETAVLFPSYKSQLTVYENTRN